MDESDEVDIINTTMSSLDRYLQSIETTRDIAAFAEQNSRLMEVGSRYGQSLAKLVAPDATPEQLSAAAGAVEEFYAKMGEVTATHRTKWTPGEVPKEIEEGIKERVAALLQDLDAQGFGKLQSGDLFLAFTRSMSTRRIPRVSVLMSSLLTAMVGAFEVFLGDAIRAFLRARPEALKSEDPTISWTELSKYSSLMDFQAAYIDSRIEGVMRGSLDDWSEWLAKKVQIRLLDYTADPVALREIFQRRHIIVHNGGKVSSLYLAKMKGMPSLPEIGDPLPVDSSYLQTAANRLSALGIALTVALSRKLSTPNAEKDPIDSLLVMQSYNFNITRDYPVTVEIADKLSDFMVGEAPKLRLRVNSWLAKRRLGLDVTEQVRQWDVSALDDAFKMARHALLEELDATYEIANRLIRAKQLTVREYNEWPLLEEVRARHPLS